MNWPSWVVVAGSLFLLQGARAQVDQEHWVEIPSRAYNGMFDLRQEFSPKFGIMDSVELSIARDGPLYIFPSSAAVEVRHGGVDGPIVGVSKSVDLPAYFSGTVVLNFAEPLALVPGGLYTLHPFSPTGGELFVDATGPDFSPGYSGGRLWFNGAFVEEDVDMRFREGIGVPEPNPLLLLTLGGGLLAVARTSTNARKPSAPAERR